MRAVASSEAGRNAIGHSDPLELNVKNAVGLAMYAVQNNIV